MKSRRSRRGRGGQHGHEPRPRIRTRELRVLELATLGWSQHQIAADIGVSQAAVSKILARIEQRLLRELSETVERQKVRQTVRLEHLYAEGVRAWEASKADATTKKQRKTQTAAGGTGSVAEIVVENSHGDPRYLGEARQALADMRKVWGLDAPQKMDLRAARNPYHDLNEDELRQKLAEQERLLERGTSADSASTDLPAGAIIRANASVLEEPPHGIE
jgi:predicted transcriptional regulator